MAASNMIIINGSNFEQEVIKSARPVLVDFWAEWCGPCKQIAPMLDELAVEYDGKVKIAKVNIDDEQNQSLASQFRITSIPTLLFFKNGQVVDQLVGARSKKDFKAKLDAVAA